MLTIWTNAQFADAPRAAELILRHLYDLGHRKIAFIRGGSHSADADERWRYYEQLAGIHRSIPHIEAPGLDATVAEIAAVRRGTEEDQA